MVKPWRLHLASSAIQHVDIIAGKPTLLAVWTRDGKVAYYDLEKGDAHGSAAFSLPEKREDYWTFAAGLKDVRGRRLAFTRVGGVSFWALENGGVLQYDGGAIVDFYKSAEDMPQTLTFDIKPAALAIDPVTRLIAAIDPKGALLLGQPAGTIKTLRPALKPAIDLPLSLAVARGGKRIVVSDGMQLVVIDSGKVSHRRELHYACGMIALSPDGKTLLVFDTDSGVLRAYHPTGLQLTHQRFVVDLLSSAEELQLIGFAELPPVSAALSALAVDNEGRFAFAVAGQVSAASLAQLTPTTPPTDSKPAAQTPKPEKPASRASTSKPAAKASKPVAKPVPEKPTAPAAATSESPVTKAPDTAPVPEKPTAPAAATSELPMTKAPDAESAPEKPVKPKQGETTA